MRSKMAATTFANGIGSGRILTCNFLRVASVIFL